MQAQPARKYGPARPECKTPSRPSGAISKSKGPAVSVKGLTGRRAAGIIVTDSARRCPGDAGRRPAAGAPRPPGAPPYTRARRGPGFLPGCTARLACRLSLPQEKGGKHGRDQTLPRAALHRRRGRHLPSDLPPLRHHRRRSAQALPGRQPVQRRPPGAAEGGRPLRRGRADAARLARGRHPAPGHGPRLLYLRRGIHGRRGKEKSEGLHLPRQARGILEGNYPAARGDALQGEGRPLQPDEGDGMQLQPDLLPLHGPGARDGRKAGRAFLRRAALRVLRRRGHAPHVARERPGGPRRDLGRFRGPQALHR